MVHPYIPSAPCPFPIMSYQAVPYQSGRDEDEEAHLLRHESEFFHPLSSPSSHTSSPLLSPRLLKYVIVVVAVLVVVALLLHSSGPAASLSVDGDSLSQRSEHSHHSSHHSSHSSANDDDSDDGGGRSHAASSHSHSHGSSSSRDEEPRHQQHGHGGGQDGEQEEEQHSRQHHEEEESRPSSSQHGRGGQGSEESESKPSSRSHPSHPEGEYGMHNDDESSEQSIEQRNTDALKDPKRTSPFTGNKGGSDGGTDPSSPLTQANCEPPYPGYPFCESKVNELQQTWAKDPETEASYRKDGVDGGKCSFLTYLNKHGFYCPEAQDYGRSKIRGVNLGGWLVLEPWIKPSLFTQFALEDGVRDQWTFCETLGKAECKKQLEEHWDTWLTKEDLKALAEGGINHVRIPVGYWILGDVKDDEPWVTGDLAYLERGLRWMSEVGLHAILDLHCVPGSQNGFDNSGRMGEVHFADSETASSGRVTYPNIDRALRTIDALTKHFSADEYKGTVVGIEPVNEAFVSIPLEIVKDYYVQSYENVKKYGDLAVVIGDSFRFGSWGDFMFPPHYRHVWIDTHIYQVFDAYRLSFTPQQHLQQTCKINKPEVAVAPLSTMVGEWSLAIFDCARWLNGYGQGARYDGTFTTGKERAVGIGSCKGQNDLHDTTVWTPEYKDFLRQYADVQMDAYESGSSAGWFFWNFKTESAPQWDYLQGLREGWIGKDHNNRKYNCDNVDLGETIGG